MLFHIRNVVLFAHFMFFLFTKMISGVVILGRYRIGYVPPRLIIVNFCFSSISMKHFLKWKPNTDTASSSLLSPQYWSPVYADSQNDQVQPKRSSRDWDFPREL